MSHWTDAYFGKPWAFGATGPEGYDCYGLVRAVYRDILGIDLPVIAVDHAPLAIRHAIRNGQSGWSPTRNGGVQDFDVVMLSHGKHPHHVGLWGGPDRVLHSVEGAGVIRQELTGLRMNGWHILGFYRHEARR